MTEKLYSHLNHRRTEPAKIIDAHVGRAGSMYRLQYQDGTTYDAYPNQVAPYVKPKASIALGALTHAERFIRGFEDDENQDDIPELLKLVRDAIAELSI